MNIATAFNKKYIPYVTVMLTSLCMNNPVHIDAYLLHSELEEDDFESISHALSSFDISLHPIRINKSDFSDKLPSNNYWSIEMYYKLMLFDTLPLDIDKIFYLDVDLIINGNITTLYNSDLTNTDMIVCHDSNGFSKIENDSDRIFQKTMLSKRGISIDNYFNVGMLLININECRQKKINFTTYVNAMEDWDYKMPVPEQDIINYVHGNHVTLLSWKEYNFIACLNIYNKFPFDEINNNTKIIHFAGEKPWESGNHMHYDLELIWWKYAKQTPCYNTMLNDFIKADISESTFYDSRINMENSLPKIRHNIIKNIEILKRIYTILFPGKDIQDEGISFINETFSSDELQDDNITFSTWSFMRNHMNHTSKMSNDDKLKHIILDTDLMDYSNNLKNEYERLCAEYDDSLKLAKDMFNILKNITKK